MNVLREAARLDPHAAWWIKADGCDVVKGLFESVRGQWSGDVNLNDGAVDRLRSELQMRLDHIGQLGLGTRRSPEVIMADLTKLKTSLIDDAEFCSSSMLHAYIMYIQIIISTFIQSWRGLTVSIKAKSKRMGESQSR